MNVLTARDIFNVLKEQPIFDSHGSLLREKNQVWSEAAEKLNGAINVHHLHESVRQDRHNLISDLRNFLGIPYPDEFRIEESKDEADSHCSSNEADDDSDFEVEDKQNLNNCDGMVFTLQLDEQE
ncbi:hypothetical protein QAD02_021102 [Eretmocerus hayati]|uniref:Uncharacterized protein n=1 Tax=Eretmocerus hayati TaxID=131215 RepID=A0ACC2PRT7_9HYME|nr:hypothetical protein QAD02_021102 [Eretmocerus hayati]